MKNKMKKQTENKRLHLFNLQYSWYEGEHKSTILGTAKKRNEIEKDLKEAEDR